MGASDDTGVGRDGGPVITKWEQLSLAPELQVSLNTFGFVDFPILMVSTTYMSS